MAIFVGLFNNLPGRLDAMVAEDLLRDALHAPAFLFEKMSVRRPMVTPPRPGTREQLQGLCPIGIGGLDEFV